MQTKSKVTVGLSLVVVLAALNLIAFIAPFERIGSFWVGYGFTTAAILLNFAVGWYALARGERKSRFYGLAIESVSGIYLLVQFVLGLLFMIIPTIDTRISVSVSVLALAACLLGVILTDAARDYIESQDRQEAVKTLYIKSMQVEVEAMLSKTENSLLKKALRELADDIRYSDPMSSPALATMENKIAAKGADLGVLVETGSTDTAVLLCDELRQLLAARNHKCKLLK